MLNVIAIQGRICAEPELKSTQSGTAVMRFCVACDRAYQAQGKEREADFIDCVAWRGTAEFIKKYFHKGSMIAIEGRIQTNNFEDKDGNKRKSTEVVCSNVSFCGSKENGSQGNTKPDMNIQYEEGFEEIGGDDDFDDLPF